MPFFNGALDRTSFHFPNKNFPTWTYTTSTLIAVSKYVHDTISYVHDIAIKYVHDSCQVRIYMGEDPRGGKYTPPLPHFLCGGWP